MKNEYPKWIYHENEAPKLVKTKEEHDQAGKGWEETPFAVSEKSNEAQKESKANQSEEIKKVDFVAMTVAELKAALIGKGVPEADLKGLKKDELIVKMGTI